MSDEVVKKRRSKRGRPKKRGRPLNYWMRWYNKNRKVKKKRKVRSDKGKARAKAPKPLKEKVEKKRGRKKRAKKEIKSQVPSGALTFVPYDIAQIIVHRAQIKSVNHYKRWRREQKIIGLPGNPNRYYSEWCGWGDFLGVHNRAFVKKEKVVYRPYWEAVRFAQKVCAEEKITTALEWKKRFNDLDIPSDIPKYPNQEYEQWSGWDVWLGKSVVAKLNAMKEVVGVVAICSVSEFPGNYIKVIIAEEGEQQLREKLQDHQGRVLKLYVWQQTTRQTFNDTLSRLTSPQGDGILLVPNINQLIFELDNVMDWFRPTVGR